MSTVGVQQSIWEEEITKPRQRKTTVELVNFPVTPVRSPGMSRENRLDIRRNRRIAYASRQLQNLLNRVGDHYIRVTQTLNARRTLQTVPKTAAPNGMTRTIRSAANKRPSPIPPVPRNNRKNAVQLRASMPAVPAVPSSRWFGMIRKAPQAPVSAPMTQQQSRFQRLKQMNVRGFLPRMSPLSHMVRR
jgi:hypothetical protein